MKNRISGIICIIALVAQLFSVSVLADNDEIKVYFNDKQIEFDVPPQIINDRTMVPMRAIFETLGYDVEWNGEKQSISAFAQESGFAITMCVGSRDMYIGHISELAEMVNDSHIELEAEPQVINDRTLVPVRAISEASGYNVKWDADTYSVIIYNDIIAKDMRMDAFEKLKNVIINNGSHVEKTYSSEVSISGTHVGDTIMLSLNYDMQQFKAAFVLLLYEDGNNVMSVNIRYKDNSDGDVTLIGYYDIETQKFEKVSGTTSEQQEVGTIKAWASALAGFDDFISGYTAEVSLSDFGIHYLDRDILETKEYENLINEVTAIKEYISNGQYLEAIDLCHKTLDEHNASPNDKQLIRELEQEATERYNAYVDEQNRYKTWNVPDWGMTFLGSSSYNPSFSGEPHGDQFVDVYRNGRSFITINSFKIGEISSEIGSKIVHNITQYIDDYAYFMGELAFEGDDYGYDFEVLSKSDTSVGNFGARQVTIRRTTYTNRYKTTAEYEIIRCTAFQYGDWIYLINCRQPNYIWDDDFYSLMDRVRTSIEFY